MDLHRLLVFGALIGGVLRIVNAFTTGFFAPQMLQVSYAVTDLFLLLGLAGVVLTWRVELELLGYIGVSLAVLGLIVIRATGFTGIAMQGYMLGAGIAVIGVAVLGADMLWRRVGGVVAPVFWLLSFALALWGALGAQATLQTLAGIAFGAGFVFVAIAMLRAEPAPAPG